MKIYYILCLLHLSASTSSKRIRILQLISLLLKNSLSFFSFLFFVFFFVASLSNLFLENLSSLFSSSFDSCFKTRSLRKIVDFVDLSIAISFLSLTKILYLSLTR